MQLHSPFIITPRLLPGIRIAGAYVQIEYAGTTSDGRTRYRWTIDLPDGSEHSADDLKSGVGGGSLQEGMGSLLSFLGACGESLNYQERKGNSEAWNDPDCNASLFPQAVAQWAAENSDEIALACCEVEENKDLILE